MTGSLVDPKISMLGGWVNPHREQQTISQGQTSKPAQICPHANGQSAPGKAALATFAGAPGATHRARPGLGLTRGELELVRRNPRVNLGFKVPCAPK